MSYHSISTKPLNASLKALLKRGGHVGLGIAAFTPVLALANPTGGQVVAGSATITTPGANGTVIKQHSQSAIIDWQQFNIGSGQYVQFLQPSSSSVILNRVIGGGSSSIYGSLTGNGQVFLVNTNGVFFGQGASIDTQGFLASTLDITDRNFMSGHYLFDQASAPGAKVINQGSITAHRGGYVVLAGDYAENDGIIAAQSGHVVLASGAKATLSLKGNSLVNFAVDQATLAGYAGVKNTGSLMADGGTVIMTADVANALKATVVNNTGLVQAQAISNQGGAIYLTATGGNIENSGTLDADGAMKGQAGGTIVLKGDGRTTLTSASKIDALGQNGAKGG
ncbi:MAG TPA: filamentous hemagglutinin N-terminal domain-containing protein, partial [Gammaproteobacteria bacterium]